MKTDTLIAAMEEAGEVKECLVLLMAKDGRLLVLGTTAQRVLRLGMLEAAKQWMVADMVAESMKEENREPQGTEVE